MKKLLLIIISIFSAAVLANPLTTLSTKEDLELYLENKHFSGVVLVADKDKVLFRKAFGFRNLQTKELITTEDKFQIGSNTKQIVAASILQLAEQGKLSLDDLISKFILIPDSYKSITIRDVLNHTSGIPNYTDVDDHIFLKNINPEKILSLDDILNFTFKYPLDFLPKSNWNYSNSGYINAGKILEAVSGQKWNEYLKNNIFLPLNMLNTGYIDSFEKISSVQGHYVISGNLEYADFSNMSWALSASGVYSTVDDLLKWLRNYSSATVITEQTIEEMTTPFLHNYGLGVKIANTKDSDIYINHDGRTPGFVSYLAHLKNRDMSFISLDNTDGMIVPNIDKILYSLFIKGTASVIKTERIILTKDQLNEYVGKYSGEGLEIETYIENGRLIFYPQGQLPFPMEAIEKDNFDIGFAGEEFIRDENGKITAVKNYQNGGISIFKKL